MNILNVNKMRLLHKGRLLSLHRNTTHAYKKWGDIFKWADHDSEVLEYRQGLFKHIKR